jgi:hypothetical protein
MARIVAARETNGSLSKLYISSPWFLNGALHELGSHFMRRYHVKKYDTHIG